MALFWFDAKAGTALFQFYKDFFVVCFAKFSRFSPFLAKHHIIRSFEPEL